MKLITRQSNANEAAASWLRQYPLDDKDYADKHVTYSKLLALGDEPHPNDVNAVIGNDVWTDTKCHECKAVNVDVVQLGQEPDYESYTTEVCIKCLMFALESLSA